MLRKISPKEIQTRVDNIMEILNLHPFKSRLPNQLSRGEAQKVTLARAMVFSPEVLLLDEPFASLDEQSITIVTSLIQKLHKTGSTIFVISHDRQLLDKISTQRVKIEAGILTSLT
jgi:energy-coupling factor transporter ATP-binding protein EcfA2